MGTQQLDDLEGLLKGRIHGTIIKQEVVPLTKPGDNFGSDILRVDITIQEGSQEKVVHGVAKLMPTNAFALEIFNVQVTFKSEIGFYSEVVPALQTFQREQGTDVADYFPELYGARISLNPQSDVVDRGGIILLENLKIKRFDNVDRMEGFDLETSRLILRTLANFHASLIGLKLKKPDEFQKKVMPYLDEWKGPEHPPLNFTHVLNESTECIPLIDRIHKSLKKKRVKKVHEPWATVTHNDFWVNNVMLTHRNGVADDIKMVDFQMIDYASPASDVLFFLFSSVKVSVQKYHFSKLLKLYYDNFIITLRELKVNTTEFTWEGYLDELKAESSYQIQHSLFMLFIIFGTGGGLPPNPKASNGGPPATNGHGPTPSNGHGPKAPPKTGPRGGNVGFPPFKATTHYKEKVWFIVQEAARRNWI